MLYLKSIARVIDNSGAQLVECIKVLGKRPKGYATLGDKIVCVVKAAKPPQGQNTVAKVKKGDIMHAVVARTRQFRRRADGSTVKFDDNAVVLVNKGLGEPIGTRVTSVVARELREKKHHKVVGLAPKVV